MTFGRLSMVWFSPPPPCGAFSEYFLQRLGSWLLNQFIFGGGVVRSQILLNLNFIPFQAIKSPKVALKVNRFWHVGNRLPPMQIKASSFRGEQGSKGWENAWSG